MKLNLTISIIRLVFEASKRQWQNESLRSLIELSNGKSMTKSRMTLDGDYPVYGANGVIGRTNEALINSATITIGRVGSCGEINKTDDMVWVSDNAMWVSSCADSLDFDYLYFALKSLNLTAGMKIAAMPSISQENVLRENIPLPSLAEQKQIALFLNQYVQGLGVENCVDLPNSINSIKLTVARVESLAARVNEAQRLREEASEGREALLYSAMRQIFKADGAKIVPLETTCAAIIDNLHSNPNYSGDCVVACIRSSDVGWGELFLETARKTSEAEYTRRTVRGEPSENDIVLVREGGGTGKAALVEKHHRFSLGQRVMMLRPDQSVVLPKFLLYQILSPFIYDEQILPLSKGSASPHLNIGSLRKFKFILPPLDEQRRIVAYLDGLQAKVNALRELQSQSQEELDALLPSVLDRAFKGEL